VCSFRRWARWQRRSSAAPAASRVLGRQGRGRLAQTGWRPCSGPDDLPVSDRAVPGPPAPERPAAGRRASDGSTGPSGERGRNGPALQAPGWHYAGRTGRKIPIGERRLAGGMRRVITRESAYLRGIMTGTGPWSSRTAPTAGQPAVKQGRCGVFSTRPHGDRVRVVAVGPGHGALGLVETELVLDGQHIGFLACSVC